jgi:ferric-dicitrate binding protein FerR (iron transport regulator)
MNNRFLLLLLTIFFCASGYPPAEARGPDKLDVGAGLATVSYLKGSAELLGAGKTAWRALKLNDALKEGDQIRTKEDGQLEVLLTDGSRLRFAGNSEFKIVHMEMDPSAPRNVNVHVTFGKIWARVAKKLGIKEKFEVSCPQAVAGVRGTVYRINVDQDQSALVRVYDGTVEVKGGGKSAEQAAKPGAPTRVAGPKPIPGPHKVTMEEWTVIIKAMQQVRIGANGVPEKARDFTEAEDRDAWVDWNQARDKEI